MWGYHKKVINNQKCLTHEYQCNICMQQFAEIETEQQRQIQTKLLKDEEKYIIVRSVREKLLHILLGECGY